MTCAAVDAPHPKDLSFRWVEPNDPAVAAIRQAGETVNDRASHTMVYEIERAVEEKGLAGAIDVVHLKQQTLPKSEPGQPQVTTLKLTSLILRNPANRPDPADQAALDMMQAAIRDGTEVPAVLVQQVDRPGAAKEWRVYRPISTRPICLKCHGPSQELDPEVRAKLALRYPGDKAKDYAVYTWRGLIRSSLVAPEAATPPAAK